MTDEPELADDQRGDEIEMDYADRRFARLERTNRHLVKKSEDYEVLNSVFDMPTLMTITKLINNGVIASVISHFGSGKESKVFVATAPDGSLLALKIYLTGNAEFKKRRQYLQGDRRFSETKKGMRNLVSIWAHKELKNLRVAYESGVSVPKPVLAKRNMLLMQFIGDAEGNAAPILANSQNVSSADYQQIIEQVRLLYQKAGLVHADLSEYNIFKTYGGEIVLFDFGSAVDVQHPNSKHFLVRDIMNINSFFEKRAIDVLDIAAAKQKISGLEEPDGKNHL